MLTSLFSRPSAPTIFSRVPGVTRRLCSEFPNIPVMDVRNQCSGFVYSLVVANALIASAQYQRIIVVGAEIHSHCLEVPETNNEVAVLFGDAAAAVALEVSDTPTILASELHVDGSGADALKMEVFDNSRRPFLTVEDIQNRRHIPVMDGIRVFRRAVAEMTATAKTLLEKAAKKLEDVDLVIAHQANLRIVEMVRHRLGLPPEKMFNNIQIRGNTTAASIPLAMVEARDAGVLRRGNLLCWLPSGVVLPGAEPWFSTDLKVCDTCETTLECV